MNRMMMAPAASALLRAILARSRASRDRILLTDLQTIDWRSLTFTGERHQIRLRVTGAGARAIVERMCAGLEDAEFSIPGVIVADIGVLGSPVRALDGSVSVTIEALTISAD